MTDPREEEVPGGPPNMLIRNGTIGDCPVCNSTTNGKKWWLWGEDLGCINPPCPNYEENSLEDRNRALAKNERGEWMW